MDAERKEVKEDFRVSCRNCKVLRRVKDTRLITLIVAYFHGNSAPSCNLASPANGTEWVIILVPGQGLLFKDSHHEWTIREQIAGPKWGRDRKRQGREGARPLCGHPSVWLAIHASSHIFQFDQLQNRKQQNNGCILQNVDRSTVALHALCCKVVSYITLHVVLASLVRVNFFDFGPFLSFFTGFI